ncbi:hemerythrin domain-containing protein [Marivivens donghaensis]|uniref:Hemerythrin domain-containing protein n=1 Tax=Marivivens donghaensis TaxID=1699413 RepID=A0ABX0VV46_9RHOB|nr:hemerythrin domain-containing protein [Marivivens donghaensis]NIY71946.1 hemerythrin domain-containing protein [Marivivens donghaensis]
MSIYDEIKADHARHRELLDKIAETTGNSEDRQTAWKEFFYDVKSHAAAEEETFYSPLMSKTWGQDSARHSVEEHAEMDDLMEELQEMDMSSSAWLTKFKQLKHDYEHHMEEEEEDIFSRAKEVIPDSELKGYGEKFRTRKEKELKLVDKKREDHLED